MEKKNFMSVFLPTVSAPFTVISAEKPDLSGLWADKCGHAKYVITGELIDGRVSGSEHVRATLLECIILVGSKDILTQYCM